MHPQCKITKFHPNTVSAVLLYVLSNQTGCCPTLYLLWYALPCFQPAFNRRTSGYCMGTLRVVNILCFLLLLLLVLSTVTCPGFRGLTHSLSVLRAEYHSCKVATVCCKMHGDSHVLDFADGETCAVQLPDSDRLDSGKHVSLCHIC